MLRARQQPGRVQDERHLGCDVDEGGKEWVQEALLPVATA
jgi:hypothetical protein